MKVADYGRPAIGTRVLMRLLVGSALAALWCAHAQVITTFAGTDSFFRDDGKLAVNAALGRIRDVVLDSTGDVIAVDQDNCLVVKISRNGVLKVLAGNGIQGFTGDGGQATRASFYLGADDQAGIVTDSLGNTYIADAGNGRVRKVSSAGIVTTIAGGGSPSDGVGDGGPAIQAVLNVPSALAIDAGGNLYIAERGGMRVRRVASSGIITTVAGGGSPVDGVGDGGPATQASIPGPVSLAVDGRGNLYIADEVTSRVRKVGLNGIISTVINRLNSGDVRGIALDKSGNLFIADFRNSAVLELSADGSLRTVAGNGRQGFSGDGGDATKAMLGQPFALRVDQTGNIYIADWANKRVRKVDTNGTISTVAGTGNYRYFGDGGPAVDAYLNFQFPEVLTGLAVDSKDNVYIADPGNQRIRKVSPDGIISTVAGNGTQGYSGDGGLAVEAAMNFPNDVMLDAADNLYILDAFNGLVRKVDGNGIITTVAYTALDGGPVTLPAGFVAVDASGDVYYDDLNGQIHRVMTDGSSSIFAGAFGYSPPACVDNLPAVGTPLGVVYGIATDATGRLFVLDGCGVRVITADGIIHVVPSGQSVLGLAAGGGLTVDRAGDLYFGAFVGTQSTNVLTTNVVELKPDGTLVQIAGKGEPGFSGDGGLATNAALTNPGKAVADSKGNVYITDSGNNRVRVVLAAAPTVGVSPSQLQFTAPSNGAPTPVQTLVLNSSISGVGFSIEISPAVSWLDVSPQSGGAPRLLQVSANPMNLPSDIYRATITIITRNAVPSSSTVAVAFTVKAGVAPTLSIDKHSLSFPYPQHGKARSQTISVSNAGGGTLDFTVTPTTVTGGPWLSVSPANGRTLPASPAKLTVTADPTGLSPGTYTGEVTITAGTQSQSIPVTMTISTLDQAILLSQTGMSFLAVAQGGILPAQNVRVLNIGSGVVAWKVSKSTLSGGQDWLQITPINGMSDAAQNAPTVSVSVNAAGLAQGPYYGQVRVDAPGAANTPQVLTVFLQVLPAGSVVEAIVQPSELVFTAKTGGESPGSQNVELYNVVAEAKSFLSSVAMESGLTIATLPQAATLDPQQPTSIVVQPFTSGLAPGVHNGTLTLQFSDGRVKNVKITVIVSGTGAAPSSNNLAQEKSVPFANTGACKPSKLIPALSTLGQSFAVTAGWPVALGVKVLDDCGSPLNSGAVTVDFSNSDPSISLGSLNDGIWNGTWQTGTSASAQSQVTLTVTATTPDSRLTGRRELAGGLRSQQTPPIVKGSILSAASALSFVPLAPGSMISIYGSGLADGQESASTVPLPTQLGNASVFMAGQLMPLLYVSDKQINAVVPFSVNTNTQQQVLVLRDLTYSVPVQVDVAAAEPAIFTSAGAGIFIDYRDGTPGFLVTPSTPAKIGDVLVAYCSGLGATSPTVPDGEASPISPAAKTQHQVSMSIGGKNAPVSFAGLVPGLVGLYQINTQVPAGVQPGNSVPVTITVSGQVSPSVHIAVR